GAVNAGGSPSGGMGSGGSPNGRGGSSSGKGGSGNGGASAGSGGGTVGPTLGTGVTVHLVPASGVSGSQRINFAVPFQPGQLADASQLRAMNGTVELKAGRRTLATYADGRPRSVQIQFDLDVAGETDVAVRVGETPTTDVLPLVPVEDTL